MVKKRYIEQNRQSDMVMEKWEICWSFGAMQHESDESPVSTMDGESRTLQLGRISSHIVKVYFLQT